MLEEEVICPLCLLVTQMMSLAQDRDLVPVPAAAVPAAANQVAAVREVAQILGANRTLTLRSPRKRMIKATKLMERR